jgi:hypothetical protein
MIRGLDNGVTCATSPLTKADADVAAALPSFYNKLPKSYTTCLLHDLKYAIYSIFGIHTYICKLSTYVIDD